MLKKEIDAINLVIQDKKNQLPALSAVQKYQLKSK